MSISSELIEKYYAVIDRLAKRIGIDPEGVYNVDIIVSGPVVAVAFKYKFTNWYGNETVRHVTGHAICMRDDTFNFDIGLNIAIARAMRVAYKYQLTV